MVPIISFKNFSFKYRNLSEPTLKNIDLDIYEGEKILIAGLSGSGKSTLAHCINGLIPFSYDGEMEGNLIIKGIQPRQTSIFEISKIIGTILQDQDGQFIGLSVGEDVAFAAENDMEAQDIMVAKVEETLETVDMLKYINKSPYELSGGQKQRVSLAGILSMKAEVLLFDEPLANLDPAGCKKTMELINDIHKKTRKTIVIIEHRIEDVLEQPFDKVVVIDRGGIKAYSTPDQILSSDILRKLGLREPLYIEALKYAKCELNQSDQISDISNLNKAKFKKSLLSWYQQVPKTEHSMHQSKVLSLENIKFSYDKRDEIIKGISFNVYEGEIVSILGNNGAGKSTLSNLITGICSPTEGSIHFRNENINDWSIKKRGQKIGYVMQNPNLMITQHMIKDEIGFGLVAQGMAQDLIDQKVDRVLKICGLYPYRNWPVQALSYGQKKRLTIASILVLEPQIIILDEPTAGQDYKHYTDFMEFIRSLSDEGIAIILITHDMHLALEYANRAIVISDGKKIADGRVATILTNRDVIKQASLKETSLSKMARIFDIDQPDNFVQFFIEHEKRVKKYE